MVRLDALILRRHFPEYPLPEVVSEAQDVALVRHRDLWLLPALSPTVPRRVAKGMPDDPFHPLAGVDVLLDGDLVGGSLLEVPSHPHVKALRVLPEDHEVDLLASPLLERAQPAGQAAHGSLVHIQVQMEAGAEQDVRGVLHVRHPGIAKGAHQDRVESAEFLQGARGKRLAGAQVPFGAKVVTA